MPVYQDPQDGRLVEAKALRSWTANLVGRLGTPDDIASDVAEVLLASDLRGIASHGTARLPQYVKLVEAGVMDPAARPVHEKGKAALARFDARNGWGHHAARVATDDAISRSRDVGAAISVVRNTNHYGIAGWYAMRAAQEGLIGVSVTNTSPLVAPTRARVSMLGTNPIAVAAPAGRFGMLVLDMATATVPRGRIEVAARRGETLPLGWAIGPDGSPATTPEEALAGSLLPLGGEEASAGYKGYGLALVVELLTGILGDAAFGPNIIGLFSTEGKSDLGQFFMAIDPGVVDGPASFVNRLEKLIDQLTSAPLIPDAPGPVLYAGQPEAERAAHQARNGIVIDREHHESLIGLGERYQLRFPRVRSLTRSRAGGRKTGDLREGKSS
jgi:LDH2 family malate/lactate/ureidoglycolate dehydrogenase